MACTWIVYDTLALYIWSSKFRLSELCRGFGPIDMKINISTSYPVTCRIALSEVNHHLMPNSLLSSTLTAVSNHLKPHRAEALQRIRLNALCLVTTLIVSYLLPVPSLLTAARTLLTSSHHQRWSTEWIYEWICVFGMLNKVIFF